MSGRQHREKKATGTITDTEPLSDDPLCHRGWLPVSEVLIQLGPRPAVNNVSRCDMLASHAALRGFAADRNFVIATAAFYSGDLCRYFAVRLYRGVLARHNAHSASTPCGSGAPSPQSSPPKRLALRRPWRRGPHHVSWRSRA